MEDSSFKLKLSKINFKKIENLVSVCWMSCWLARIVLIQICLVYQVKFGRSNQSSNQDQSAPMDANYTLPAASETNAQFYHSLAYRILFHFGSVYRELGILAVFCYSCFTVAALYHPKCPIISDNFRQVCQQEFVVFLSDPEKSKKMTSNRLRDRLALAIHSNLNYTRSILDLMLAKSAGSHPRRQQDSLCGLKPTVGQLWRLNRKIERSIEQSRDIYHMAENRTFERLTGDLRRQYNHLVQLGSGEQSNCWPVNRRAAEDRAQMSRQYLYLASAFCLYLFFAGVLSFMFASNLAHKTIINSRNLPEEMRRFSPMERLMVCDTYVFNLVASYWSTSKIIMLIVVLKNQSKVIIALEQKFKLLSAKMDEFSSFSNRQQPKLGPEYDGWPGAIGGFALVSEAPDGRLGRQTRKTFLGLANENGQFISCLSFHNKALAEIRDDKLRCECDQLAMEIYISFRMFLAELDGLMQLVRHVIITVLIFVGYCITLTLVCFTNIRSDELNIMVLVVCLSIIYCNCNFLVCAAFSASAIKLNKSIFSLIAQTLTSQAGAFAGQPDKQLDRFRLLALRANQRMAMFRQGQLIPSELMHISADINYLADCAISPHTLQLWRRLVRDSAPLETRLFCTVAGFLKLEHRSILHFNFWITSVVLVSLIWISHMSC